MYDLTSVTTDGKNTALFYNPKGLGFKYTGNFIDVGGTLLRNNRRIAPLKISGVIYFPNPHAYDSYFAFVNTFLTETGLVLLYRPNGRNGEEFEFDVEVSELTKSELTKGGLHCRIDMQTLSLPRKKVFVETSNNAPGGKTYNYKYDYTYSNSGKNTVTIDVDSDYKTPVKICIYGSVKDPKWKHYVNDELTTTGEVFAQVYQGNNLVIDARVPYSIRQFDSAGNLVANQYQASNFETERFVFLRRGRNVITVSDNSGKDIDFYVTGGITYASV